MTVTSKKVLKNRDKGSYKLVNHKKNDVADSADVGADGASGA